MPWRVVPAASSCEQDLAWQRIIGEDRLVMAVSPGFAEFVVAQLEGCGTIVTKKMFGGLGIYAGDVFFAFIAKDVLYLEVDDTPPRTFTGQGGVALQEYGDAGASLPYSRRPPC